MNGKRSSGVPNESTPNLHGRVRRRVGALTVRAMVGVLVVAALIFGAAAYGGGGTSSAPAGASAPPTQKYAGRKIGSVLWGADRYQVAHGKRVEEYAKQFGIKVQTVDGKQSATVQANAIEDLIAAKVDGILFQPFDPSGAIAPIKAAQKAGIPIVTWAIKPAKGVVTPFLELNEYKTTFEAGVNAARRAHKLWPKDKLRVVALDIPTVALCSKLRIQGFVDGVKSADPKAEIIARPDGKGNRLASTTVMEDQIQKDPNFNIVTACNGEMLFGGLAALKAAGRGKATNKVPKTEYLFVIADGITEIESYLDPKSPIMQVAVLAPKTNAHKFLDLLIKVWDGKVKPKQAYVEKTGSLLLPTNANCTQINKLLVGQYGKGVRC